MGAHRRRYDYIITPSNIINPSVLHLFKSAYANGLDNLVVPHSSNASDYRISKPE